MISVENRKAIFGFGLAGLLFWLSMRTFLKKKDPANNQPLITQDNIDIALTAYSSAVANGEQQSVLNDLNESTAKEYGLRVYQKKSDGTFVVTDLAGNEVKTAA